MQFFLVSLLSLLFIAVLTRYLYKNQQRKTIETADLATPLPPLGQDAGNAGMSAKIGIAPALNNTDGEGLSWQEEVSNLRETGHFQEALSLCRRQYPKMLAFDQTLITLRARIRDEENVSEETLKTLYKTAILADCLNTGNAHVIEDVSLKLEQMDNPRLLWQTLGYRNLDLLTRYDRELLATHWGEPVAHGNVESVLETLP